MTPMTKLISHLLIGGCLLVPYAHSDDSDVYDKLIAMQQQIDDLSHKLNGRTASGETAASEEDVETLRAHVKELRGRIEELEHGQKTGPMTPATSSSTTQHEDHDFAPLPQPASAKQTSVDVGEDDIDDLMVSLSGKSTSSQVDKERDLATKNADKNAPTATLDMDNAMAQYNQAMALYNKGEFAEAEEAFRYYIDQYKTAKQVNPAKLKIAHCGLALAKEMDGKAKTAKAKDVMKEYASCYKANPKGSAGADALLGMGETISLQGDQKKACLVLKKLKSDFPKEKAIMAKTTGLMKQNKCS